MRPLGRGFFLRFDVRSLEATKQVLPIDGGRNNAGHYTGGERVVVATFVPGETSAICLGLTRDPPTEPLAERALYL